MPNFVLRFGLIGGSIAIGLGLINWFTVSQAYGPRISQILGYLALFFALLCIPLGIWYYREKLNDGTVSFASGFRIGLGISFIASLMVGLYSFLFFVFAGDSFDQWSKRGLSNEELSKLQIRLEQTPEFVSTPWFQGFVLFMTAFVIGSIINLISSLVLKRSRVDTP